MKRLSFLPAVVVAIVLTGIVGVMLFRVAADQKRHSVLLKWTPSRPKPGMTVASYDIYRSKADGSVEKVASGVTAPSYVDNNVRSGKTYDYYVRAVDAQGKVSPPSNHASVTVP